MWTRIEGRGSISPPAHRQAFISLTKKKVYMEKFIPLLCAALVQTLAGAAFAQGSGEVDPSQGKAPPVARTTPAERSEARTDGAPPAARRPADRRWERSRPTH